MWPAISIWLHAPLAVLISPCLSAIRQQSSGARVCRVEWPALSRMGIAHQRRTLYLVGDAHPTGTATEREADSRPQSDPRGRTSVSGAGEGDLRGPADHNRRDPHGELGFVS